MSLEASISELNTNIVALISVMSGASVSKPAPAATPAKSGTKKAAPAAALEASAPTDSATASAPQPVVASTPSGAAPTIETARKLVIEVGQKKGREAVMTLLTKFGASKLPEVAPHQYAALIADAQAALV